MNALICLLATTAAIAVFLFDKDGRTHKPANTVLAWLYFVLFASTAIAAGTANAGLRDWFLVGILALNTLMLIIKKGNIACLFALFRCQQEPLQKQAEIVGKIRRSDKKNTHRSHNHA